MIFPLDLDPFPHAVGEVALYDALPIWLPEGKENVQIRLTAREFMAKMPPARQFVEYHTSTEFLRRIFDAYGEVIYRMYPRLRDLPLEACIRGEGNAPYQLDCQLAVNTPNTTRSRVVGPHIDNPKELYAFLIYCGDGEGSLELRRWNRSPRFYGKSHARDEDCPVFKVVPYLKGNVAFFINSPYSVHSVSSRLSSEYRKYINIICEVNFPLFEIPRAEDDPYPGKNWCSRGVND